jgi:hypothetical protein
MIGLSLAFFRWQVSAWRSREIRPKTEEISWQMPQ